MCNLNLSHIYIYIYIYKTVFLIIYYYCQELANKLFGISIWDIDFVFFFWEGGEGI